MISSELVIKFLNMKSALNRTQIEKEVGSLSRILYKVLDGLAKLNKTHLSKLELVLRLYGYLDELFPKAKVISIVNHKGGVGKTTLTINIGKALDLLCNIVLMIDMNSQENLLQCFGIHSPDIMKII
jgi:chromosome partitioning protein